MAVGRTGRSGNRPIEPASGLVETSDRVFGAIVEQKDEGGGGLLARLRFAICLETMPILGRDR